MKRIYKFLILIIILMPFNVYAASGSVSIVCSPNELKPGDITDCTIKGNIDADITSLSIGITKSDKISIQSFTQSSKWACVGSCDVSNNSIDMFSANADPITGSFDIGSLTLKISSDASNGNETIELNNIIFYYSGDTSEEYNISNTTTSLNIKQQAEPEPSGDVGLVSLSITGGMLLNTFDSNTKAYAVQLNKGVNTFSISATPKNGADSIVYMNADNNSTINPNNINFETSGGKSQMSIRIIVGSGSSEVVYNLSVIKQTENPDSNSNELSTLTIGDVNVNLVKNVYDYEVTLSNIDSYQVNATLVDSSNYKIDNYSFPTKMSGEQELGIVIVPKNNSSGLSGHTYKIVIKAKNTPTPTPTPTVEPTNNPTTGGSTTSIVMAIVLVISFTITIYLYKRNIENYN